VLSNFYRTRSGLEIDLIIETQQGIVGMEIKSRDAVSSADVHALREVATKLGSEWRGGIVVYRGKEIRKNRGAIHLGRSIAPIIHELSPSIGSS
jgi:Holliday junction resolvase-like predicted endonuclease